MARESKYGEGRAALTCSSAASFVRSLVRDFAPPGVALLEGPELRYCKLTTVAHRSVGIWWWPTHVSRLDGWGATRNARSPIASLCPRLVLSEIRTRNLGDIGRGAAPRSAPQHTRPRHVSNALSRARRGYIRIWCFRAANRADRPTHATPAPRPPENHRDEEMTTRAASRLDPTGSVLARWCVSGRPHDPSQPLARRHWVSP
jgi:hypothetical protein